MADLYIDDVGTLLRITITEDGNVLTELVESTERLLKIQRPDKTMIYESISFYTDGTDGILAYFFKTGDLSLKGNYKGQVRVTFPTGHWNTTEFSFSVKEILPELET